MRIRKAEDLLEDLIKDLYSAEQQTLKGLKKLSKFVNDETLRQSFIAHIEETEEQKNRLDKVAELLGINPRGKKCIAIEGLLAEAEETIDSIEDESLIDPAIIIASQKIEHYEIASYGSACAHAKLLGNQEVLELLLQTLEEEKQQDEILTEMAEQVSNPMMMETTSHFEMENAEMQEAELEEAEMEE